MAIACAAGSTPALARDRPAAPADVRAFAQAATATAGPAIHVTFRNAATESVRFWVEWRQDGIALAPEGLAASTGGGAKCTTNHSCSGLYPNVAPGLVATARYTGRDEIAQAKEKGFTVWRVDFDSEFCFRLKSQREADGVVSADWSAWACARTGSPPALPDVPRNPQATVLAPVAGRGRPGAGEPPRMLIEWDSAGRNVGWHALERLETGPTKKWVRTHDDIKSWGEFLFDLSQMPTLRIDFRLCAVNVAGSACSAAFTYRIKGDHLGGVKDGQRAGFADRGKTVPGIGGTAGASTDMVSRELAPGAVTTLAKQRDRGPNSATSAARNPQPSPPKAAQSALAGRQVPTGNTSQRDEHAISFTGGKPRAPNWNPPAAGAPATRPAQGSPLNSRTPADAGAPAAPSTSLAR
jgi:hypothetical protein